jgi:hypothetical protein
MITVGTYKIVKGHVTGESDSAASSEGNCGKNLEKGRHGELVGNEV